MPEGRTVINNDNWTHIVGCTGLRQASLASVGAKVAMALTFVLVPQFPF